MGGFWQPSKNEFSVRRLLKGVLSVETVLEEEGALALTDVNSIAVTVHTYKNDEGETSAFDFYP